MNLGEYIKKYREDHSLSQRTFAKYCGLSNSYISLIEKGQNNKTGAPIIPTVQQLYKIAFGMGLSLHEMLNSIDDSPIYLVPSSVQEEADDPNAGREPIFTIQAGTISSAGQEDRLLALAYHAAPENIRQSIDLLLAPYMPKE